MCHLQQCMTNQTPYKGRDRMRFNYLFHFCRFQVAFISVTKCKVCWLCWKESLVQLLVKQWEKIVTHRTLAFEWTLNTIKNPLHRQKCPRKKSRTSLPVRGIEPRTSWVPLGRFLIKASISIHAFFIYGIGLSKAPTVFMGRCRLKSEYPGKTCEEKYGSSINLTLHCGE